MNAFSSVAPFEFEKLFAFSFTKRDSLVAIQLARIINNPFLPPYLLDFVRRILRIGER